jgi:hypothetical protein
VGREGIEPRTAATAAAKIHCPARSTETLLDAMAVLSLVVRRGTSYELAPLARTFLVPGGPTYLGDASNIFSGPLLWEAFGKLTEAVCADGSVLDKHAETPSNAFWETFARSSAALAFPAAAALAELLAPIAAAKKSLRVLDVAAGSGIYGSRRAPFPERLRPAKAGFLPAPHVRSRPHDPGLARTGTSLSTPLGGNAGHEPCLFVTRCRLVPRPLGELFDFFCSH